MLLSALGLVLIVAVIGVYQSMSKKPHSGVMVVSGTHAMDIPLAFRPAEVWVEFEDAENQPLPTCNPSARDWVTCEVHRQLHHPLHRWALRITWSVANARTVRWGVEGILRENA